MRASSLQCPECATAASETKESEWRMTHNPGGRKADCWREGGRGAGMEERGDESVPVHIAPETKKKTCASSMQDRLLPIIKGDEGFSILARATRHSHPDPNVAVDRCTHVPKRKEKKSKENMCAIKKGKQRESRLGSSHRQERRDRDSPSSRAPRDAPSVSANSLALHFRAHARPTDVHPPPHADVAAVALRRQPRSRTSRGPHPRGVASLAQIQTRSTQLPPHIQSSPRTHALQTEISHDSRTRSRTQTPA
ncbi:hypothetical protein K438DRAFT_2077231 [Mycena galopus ATCC 62051]|nr:hypothetical protein K438DRAFT_2077231 [Mycena galopus ATCC 62051]